MRINKSDAALAEVDMTPMIDIVFQLIAFFMVISNFEQTQADVGTEDAGEGESGIVLHAGGHDRGSQRMAR